MPHMYPLIPRVPRPRGLGGLAQAASGLGTWVVDKPWGLSPAIIPGQPQPYQNAIRTILPRAQRPRLLNLHQGPVVPTGTWPVVRPTNAPVFRTPLVAAGERAVDEQLPFAGYGSGWVPLGVAQPPYFLVGTKDMKQGWSGFGQENAEGGTTVNVGGRAVRVTAAAQAQAEANPNLIYDMVRDAAVVYTDLLAQRDMYETVRVQGTKAYTAAGVAEPEVKAMQDATAAAFGNAAAQNDAVTKLNKYGTVVSSLTSMMDRGELTGLPASVQQAINAMQKTSTRPDLSGTNTLLTTGPKPPYLGTGAITLVGTLLALGVLAIAGATTVGIMYGPEIADWGVEAEKTKRARAEADLARIRAQSEVWKVYDRQKAALMQRLATSSPGEGLAIKAQIAELDKQYRATEQAAKRAPREAAGGRPADLLMPVIAFGALFALGGGLHTVKGWFAKGQERRVQKKRKKRRPMVLTAEPMDWDED